MTFYRQASCDKCVHLRKIMLRKDFSCLLLIISHFQAIEELFFFRSLVFGNVLCGPLWNIHLICIFRIFVFSISFLSIFVGCFFLHFTIGKILSVCAFLASPLINFYVKHTFRGFRFGIGISSFFTTFVFRDLNSSRGKNLQSHAYLQHPSPASIFNRGENHSRTFCNAVFWFATTECFFFRLPGPWKYMEFLW